eukprot:gene269-893_t
MACATLKRSYDFDPLLSPSQIQRSPKRRRFNVSNSNSPIKSTETCKSPFTDRTPKLCRDELSANVYEEWKRIQRRQRIMGDVSPQSTSRHPTPVAANKDASNPTPSNQMQLPLPVMPFHNLSTFSGISQQASPCSSSVEVGVKAGPAKDQPMFTAKQVIMLCERLWKEREEKLKEEYDQVLHERLLEQYNTFLKFTQDQIMRRYREPECSYPRGECVYTRESLLQS